MTPELGVSARKHGHAVRAFVALPLPEALVTAVAKRIEVLWASRDGDAVRWVAPASLHLTLRFLGNVATGDVPALVESLEDALADASAFAVKLGAPQPFPAPRRPRGVVLGVSPEAPVEALAARVQAAIEPHGFVPEKRAFRAHVTLGRLRSRRCPALDLAAPEPGEWWVDRVVLFRSDLAHDGARHHPLATIPLGDAMTASPSAHP